MARKNPKKHGKAPAAIPTQELTKAYPATVSDDIDEAATTNANRTWETGGRDGPKSRKSVENTGLASKTDSSIISKVAGALDPELANSRVDAKFANPSTAAKAQVKPAEMADSRAMIQIGIAEALITKAERSSNLAIYLAEAIQFQTRKLLRSAGNSTIQVQHLDGVIQAVEEYVDTDKDYSHNFARYVDWEKNELRGEFEQNRRIHLGLGRIQRMMVKKIDSETGVTKSFQTMEKRPRVDTESRKVLQDLLIRLDNPNSMTKVREKGMAHLNKLNAERIVQSKTQD